MSKGLGIIQMKVLAALEMAGALQTGEFLDYIGFYDCTHSRHEEIITRNAVRRALKGLEKRGYVQKKWTRNLYTGHKILSWALISDDEFQKYGRVSPPKRPSNENLRLSLSKKSLRLLPAGRRSDRDF